MAILHTRLWVRDWPCRMGRPCEELRAADSVKEELFDRYKTAPVVPTAGQDSAVIVLYAYTMLYRDIDSDESQHQRTREQW